MQKRVLTKMVEDLMIIMVQYLGVALESVGTGGHLNKGDRPGTGGDMLRSKIRKYMGQGDLKEAPGTSPGSANERQRKNSPIQTEEYNLLQRLLVAEAGGEGLTGMAMVARSVLNRAGLIQKGIVGPGMFMAKSGSIRDVIMASGQYQPIRDGAIHRPMSERQLALAAKAIGIAQNEAALRGHLEAAGKKPHEIHKLLGATGFRTGAAFNDPSQNVNVTKLGNHMFNTAGNSAIKMFSSDFAGRHAPGSEPGVQQSARAPQRGLLGGLLPTALVLEVWSNVRVFLQPCNTCNPKVKDLGLVMMVGSVLVSLKEEKKT